MLLHKIPDVGKGWNRISVKSMAGITKVGMKRTYNALTPAMATGGTLKQLNPRNGYHCMRESDGEGK
jgi:hypothetical protein